MYLFGISSHRPCFTGSASMVGCSAIRSIISLVVVGTGCKTLVVPSDPSFSVPSQAFSSHSSKMDDSASASISRIVVTVLLRRFHQPLQPARFAVSAAILPSFLVRALLYPQFNCQLLVTHGSDSVGVGHRFFLKTVFVRTSSGNTNAFTFVVLTIFATKKLFHPRTP